MNSYSMGTGVTASSQAAEAINYDSTPLVEVDIEGIDYRIDAGKQGTALFISSRQSGAWDWEPGGEARWDGSMLRCKAFDRSTLTVLARAFKEELAALE